MCFFFSTQFFDDVCHLVQEECDPLKKIVRKFYISSHTSDMKTWFRNMPYKCKWWIYINTNNQLTQMRLIWTDKSVIGYIFVMVIFVCYICKSNTSPQAHFLNPMLLSKSRLHLTTTKSSTLSGFSLDLLGVTTCPAACWDFYAKKTRTPCL